MLHTHLRRSAQQSLPFAVQPPLEDWPHLLPAYPNLLITCPTHLVDAFLSVLRPKLRQPIQRGHCGAGLPWPTFADGTFVLRDPDLLTSEQQRDLVRRFDDSRGRIQLVSITTTPLFPRVEAGTFLDCLYYRLNAVSLAVEALPPHAA